MTTQKTLPKNCRFIYADATEYTDEAWAMAQEMFDADINEAKNDPDNIYTIIVCVRIK